MAVLVRPRSWGQTKPPPGAQINWDHPLALGLTFAVVLGETVGAPRDHVRGRQSSTVGYSGNRAMPVGPHGARLNAAMDGTSSMGFNFGSGPESAMTDALTVAVGAFATSGSQTGSIATRDSDTGGRAFVLDMFGSQLRFYINGAAIGTDLIQGQAPASLTQFDAVGVYDSTGPFIRLYLDGLLLNQSSGTPPESAINTTTANFRVGRRDYVGAEDYWSGGISYAYLWHRPLTAQEIRQLTVEPYAFFVPPGPKMVSFDLSVPSPPPSGKLFRLRG